MTTTERRFARDKTRALRIDLQARIKADLLDIRDNLDLEEVPGEKLTDLLERCIEKAGHYKMPQEVIDHLVAARTAQGQNSLRGFWRGLFQAIDAWPEPD